MFHTCAQITSGLDRALAEALRQVQQGRRNHRMPAKSREQMTLPDKLEAQNEGMLQIYYADVTRQRKVPTVSTAIMNEGTKMFWLSTLFMRASINLNETDASIAVNSRRIAHVANRKQCSIDATTAATYKEPKLHVFMTCKLKRL